MTNIQNVKIFIEIHNINGFEQAYSVSYFVNNVQYNLFVILEKITLYKYTTVVLGKEDFSIKHVFSVDLFEQINSLTGFEFRTQTTTVTVTISQIITIFINRYVIIVKVEKALISAAQAATAHYHLSIGGAQLTWRITIVDFKDQISVMKVAGFNNLDQEIVVYTTHITEYDDLGQGSQGYSVTLSKSLTKETYTFDVIVYRVRESITLKEERYYNAIIVNQHIVGKIVNYIIFRGEYFEVTSKTFIDIDINHQKDIDQFTKKDDFETSYKEANAAVVGILKWVLDVQDIFTVELHTTFPKEGEQLVTVKGLPKLYYITVT